jgi:bacillithiol system protein YtxJ
MSFFSKIFNENSSNVNQVNWIPLETLEQLDKIVADSFEKAALIFKHSTRCSISRFALKRFESEFNLEEKLSLYYLDLLNFRSISNEIAVKFDVQHQSPQVLLIKEGKVIYHDSHDGILVEEIANVL